MARSGSKSRAPFSVSAAGSPFAGALPSSRFPAAAPSVPMILKRSRKCRGFWGPATSWDTAAGSTMGRNPSLTNQSFPTVARPTTVDSSREKTIFPT